MTYTAKRRIVRIILVIVFFAIPFIKINGLPLLRFDVRNIAIYMAGTAITPSHIFPLLLLIFSALFFFIYITQLFGRVWCGWLCPQTITLECVNEMSLRVDKRDSDLAKGGKKTINILIKLILSIVFSSVLMFYFMSPADFFSSFGGAVTAFWIGLSLIVFLDLLLVGRIFCKSVCPYSIFQSVMYDADTMRIGFHPERVENCINCNACVRVCPTGLDIREGLSNKCISCATCVDECTKILSKLKNQTSVDYFFGRLNFKPFRVNTVITLLLAVLFMVFGIVSVAKIGNISFKAGHVQSVDGGYRFDLEVKNNFKERVTLTISSQDNRVTLETDHPFYSVSRKELLVIPVEAVNAEDNVTLILDVFAHRRQLSKTLKVELE